MNAKDETQQPKEPGATCVHTTDCPEGARETDSPATVPHAESGPVDQPVNPEKHSLAVVRLARAELDTEMSAETYTRPVDGFQTIANETRRRKRFIFLCASLSLASLFITAAIALLAYHHFRSRPASGPYEIKSSVSGPIPQPAVKAPKSLSNLKVGKFNLAKRHGSNLSIAAGDIENVSEHRHTRVRVELSILGTGGVVLETVSEMITELPPHMVWHVSAKASDPAAVGVAFAGISED